MNKALLQLHIAVFLAGFTAILGKLISLNAVVLVWYRLVISVVILSLILLYKKEFKKISFTHLVKIFMVGFIVALHWVTFYASIKYANASVAVVCISAAGFFTAIFEPIILKRKIQWIQVFLGLIAILGVYVIFDFHPQYKLGIFLGVLSAFGSAIFPIFNKQFMQQYNPRIITFYELLAGVILLSLCIPYFLINGTTTQWLPTYADLFWLIILAWGCTVFSFNLQLKSLLKLSAFTTSLIYNLEPIYGIILAFIFFKENKDLNGWFYFGVALILSTVIVQMIRVKKID